MHRSADDRQQRPHPFQGFSISAGQHREGAGPSSLGATCYGGIDVVHALLQQAFGAGNGRGWSDGGAVEHHASRRE